MAKAKYVTVRVTKEDIKRGKPHDPDCCPVALAADRRGFFVVGVNRQYIEVEPNDLYSNDDAFKELLLPKLAQRFIDDFDHGKPVKPMKFKLRLPGGMVVLEKKA